MKEILYVWNYREWGGAQIYFMSLMKEAKKIYTVTALLPENSDTMLLQYLSDIDVPVSFLPPVESSGAGKGFIAKLAQKLAHLRSEARMVGNILGRENVSEQIVHIDLGFWQSFLSLSRLCHRTNVFTTVHTGLPALTGWRRLRWKIKGQMISRYSKFHLMASNADAKESLRPYISPQKFDQVQVAYSGFDPSEIQRVLDNQRREENREKRQLPNNVMVLITVGQFIERKGCWILLEALRRLKTQGHSFTFLWLATTALAPEVLEKIKAYGLGNSFRVLGGDEIGNTRDDLLSLMSLADIFVLASLQEGLPIALVEAMALGLACIATRINAIPEAITDGENGILVPPNDPSRLPQAIEDLLSDSEKRKRLGAAAKRTAYERFDERITAERTLKLYDAVWKSNS